MCRYVYDLLFDEYSLNHDNFKYIVFIAVPVIFVIIGIARHRFYTNKFEGFNAMIEFIHYNNRLSFSSGFISTTSAVVLISGFGAGGIAGPLNLFTVGLCTVVINLVDRAKKIIQLTQDDKYMIVISGVGASLSALTGSAIGSAIFVYEILYRDTNIRIKYIISTLMATSFSTFIYRDVFHKTSVLDILGSVDGFEENFDNVTTATVVGIPITIFLTCLGAYIFMKLMGQLGVYFAKFKNAVKRAFVGGVIVSVLIFFVPVVNNNTHVGALSKYIIAHTDNVNFGDLNVLLAIIVICILVLFAKMIATAVTVVSVGYLGLIAPSFTLGSAIGVSVFMAMQVLEPGMNHNYIALFQSIGLICFTATVLKTPIASIVIVAEITNTLNISWIYALSIVAILPFIEKMDTLFRTQPQTDSPTLFNLYNKHTFNLSNLILTSPRVETSIAFSPNDSVETMISKIMQPKYKKLKQEYYPIIDNHLHYYGTVGRLHLFEIYENINKGYGDEFYGESSAKNIFAKSLTLPMKTLRLDSDARGVKNVLKYSDYELVPVVCDNNRLLTYLPLDLLHKYKSKLKII